MRKLLSNVRYANKWFKIILVGAEFEHNPYNRSAYEAAFVCGCRRWKVFYTFNAAVRGLRQIATAYGVPSQKISEIQCRLLNREKAA